MQIKKDDYIFSVDVEKTKEYYKTISLCECDYCQYLHQHIRERFPELAIFLDEFGIDITKPDEASPIELDGEYQYTFVGYTVCGEILKSGEYEIDLCDGLFLSISVDDKFSFPNQQSGKYFSLSVFGIALPNASAKGISEKPHPISFRSKFKNLFKKH